MSDRKQNIQHFEAILNQGNEILDAMDALIEQWDSYQSQFKALMDYYSSPQWAQDYEDSNDGAFKDIACGVLSQDAVYDLYARQKAANLYLMRTALKYIEEF